MNAPPHPDDKFEPMDNVFISLNDVTATEILKGKMMVSNLEFKTFFSESICSPKDGFMYKKARAIADERLAERKFRVPVQPGYNKLNIKQYFENEVPDYHHKDRVTQIFEFIAETLTDLVTYGDKNDLPVVPSQGKLLGRGLDR